MLILDRFCVEIFRLALQGAAFTITLWLIDPALIQLHASGQWIPFALMVFSAMIAIRFVCCLLVPVRKIDDFRQRAGVLGAELARTFIVGPIMIAYIWGQFESRSLGEASQISMLAWISYWIFITNIFILLFWFLYSQRKVLKSVI